MKITREYRAIVQVDGTWSVAYLMDCHQHELANGKAKDQVHGELAARYAIEDEKAKRAKQGVSASMQRTFTVQA